MPALNYLSLIPGITQKIKEIGNYIELHMPQVIDIYNHKYISKHNIYYAPLTDERLIRLILWFKKNKVPGGKPQATPTKSLISIPLRDCHVKFVFLLLTLVNGMLYIVAKCFKWHGEDFMFLKIMF